MVTNYGEDNLTHEQFCCLGHLADLPSDATREEAFFSGWERAMHWCARNRHDADWICITDKWHEYRVVDVSADTVITEHVDYKGDVQRAQLPKRVLCEAEREQVQVGSMLRIVELESPPGACWVMLKRTQCKWS